MTTRSLTQSPLIATLVHNSAFTLDNQWLMTAMVSTLWGAWAGQDKPSTPDEFLNACGNGITVMVEGAKGHGQIGNVSFYRMATTDLDSMIAAHEMLPVEDEAGDDTSQPSFFIVGTVKFCQAVIHYLATGRGGEGANWGFHYMRHLPSVEPGYVMWAFDDENGRPQFTTGSMAEIFTGAKDALTAA